MTDDTRDRIRAATLPGWEWTDRYGITRGEVMIGLDPSTASIVDDYPETPGPRIPVSIGRCDYATLMTAEQMRDAGLQLLAVARALSPFTPPDDHTRGLRDAAEFARGMVEQSPGISASEIVTVLGVAAGVEARAAGVLEVPSQSAIDAMNAAWKAASELLAARALPMIEAPANAPEFGPCSRHGDAVEYDRGVCALCRAGFLAAISAPAEITLSPTKEAARDTTMLHALATAEAKAAGRERIMRDRGYDPARAFGPIPIAPQEPLPDPRVAFVLGLLRNTDLHGGGLCGECSARIAEAAGVSVEEVEREWRRMEDP